MSASQFSLIQSDHSSAVSSTPASGASSLIRLAFSFEGSSRRIALRMASRPVYIVCDITISEALNFWGVVRNMTSSDEVADGAEVDAFLGVIQQWLEKDVLPQVL